MNTQGMSPDEVAALDEMDADGNPKMDDTERALEARARGASAADADDDDGAEEQPAAAPAAKPAAQGQPAADEGAAAATAAPAPAAAADEDAGPPPAPAPFVPQYTAEAPADADTKLAALKSEHDKAFADLMAGVIEPEAYQEIKDRTDAERDQIKTAVLKAQVFAEANEQAQQQLAQQEWARAEKAAMDAFKAEGLDYRAKPALLAAYNVHLRALGNDAANADKDAAWFLAEANRRTRADLGMPAAPTRRNTPAAPAVDLSQMPPTLRNAPPAIDPATGGDEFAHMANLTGIEAERAFARLTPEQQERYLN